ncbi:nitronate monooxygenase [Micromonospora sp. NPDC047134]|uniref:nitronate monooxygenase n=1 Tax=Micromonospora sp. NPDC047134 TaxID=3154340 RepID=UPI0033E8E2CD
MLDTLRHPVIVAPMAGGPSTVRLVAAAAEAGGLGFLATGYRSPEVVWTELAEIRETGLPYGVNVFIPQPPVEVSTVEPYRDLLLPEAERLGVTLPQVRTQDDDHYLAKIELLRAAAPPLVSFAFGIPSAEVVATLRAQGTAVLVTVTNAAEARQAARAGADGLVAQGGTAGGHASTTTPQTYDPDRATAEVVREVLPAGLPVIAAGGVGTAEDVRLLLAAGAVAVQAGTMFLLADEAGTRAVQKAAMTGGEHTGTVVTRAFTGRPARALRNRFTDRFSTAAPLAYPAVHHLTAPLRAAAAEADDPHGLNLWAGTGHRHARPGPAAQILHSLAGAL